jgi:FkbM family methyltransferase
MLSHIRHTAQQLRHSRHLLFLGPLWSILRNPYLKVMNALGGESGITIKIAGCSMQIHPEFCTQNWEQIEVDSYRAYAAAISPDAVVIDVGAHIGTYSIIAIQKAGSRGKVLAFEPHEFTKAHLLRHLKWNGVSDQVVVRDICCGSREGMADFYCLPGQAEGMNGLVPIEGFEKHLVKITTLDKELQQLNLEPQIIKIDVEGAEWEVLRGAEECLSRVKPILFLSLHPKALALRHESEDGILDWLQKRGYHHEIIARDHEVHVIAHHSGSVNYLSNS